VLRDILIDPSFRAVSVPFPLPARHLVQYTARMDYLLEDRGTDTRWPHTIRGDQTCDYSTYLSCVFSARSASVSHLSAISMKSDFCAEVRAASANRMHSAAFLRI
jgi:hypothetical protein